MAAKHMIYGTLELLIILIVKLGDILLPEQFRLMYGCPREMPRQKFRAIFVVCPRTRKH
jgi:hypothetical protein